MRVIGASAFKKLSKQPTRSVERSEQPVAKKQESSNGRYLHRARNKFVTGTRATLTGVEGIVSFIRTLSRLNPPPSVHFLRPHQIRSLLIQTLEAYYDSD